MSIKAQKYSEIIDSAMEVMEFTHASEQAQSMESRGDFKYKGIFRVFNTIHEWTSKFTSNGILPTREQISKDNEIELDRVKYYLTEMMGKGDAKNRMIVAMPAVDFVGGGRSDLIRFVVYCRPTKEDGTSAKRYYNSYQEKSLRAIAKWLEARPPSSGSEFADLVYERIEQGRLPDTQDGADIARNFYSELDNTPERKKATYTIYARPILQKLIEGRQLLYLATNEGGEQYKGIFLNRQDHLYERFRILAEYFYENITSESKPADLDLNTVHQHAVRMRDDGMSKLPAGYRQAVQEIILLSPALGKLKSENEAKKKEQDTEEAIREIAKKPGLVDVSRMKLKSKDMKDSIVRSSQILYTEYPINGRVAEYILHTSKAGPAVKSAGDRIEKNGDDTELQILSSMGIEKLLDNEQMKEFQGFEQKALFNKLPWFVKLMRMLTGRANLKPEETAKIKSQAIKAIEEEKLRLRTLEAKREQKKLASERMKGQGEGESEDSGKMESSSSTSRISGPASGGTSSDEDSSSSESFSATKPTEKTEEALEAEEQLKKIVQILDKAWEQGLLPNREYLVQRLSGMDEESLIMFLKKHGRKDIFSFRIQNEKPEYQWPILITRRYLKQNGRKMLRKAMADADEQRNAMMPNQEKFDVATAMEDFLNRILNKQS